MQLHLVCGETCCLCMHWRDIFLRKVVSFNNGSPYIFSWCGQVYSLMLNCFEAWLLLVSCVNLLLIGLCIALASVPYSGLKRGRWCQVWHSQMSLFLGMRASTVILLAFFTGTFFSSSPLPLTLSCLALPPLFVTLLLGSYLLGFTCDSW